MGQTRNLRDGILKVKDNGANSITLALDMGDLTWTEHNNIVQVDDRGALDHVRNGDQQAVELSFSIKVDRLHATSGNPTLRQALKKVGQAASWASVGAAAEPYMVKLEFTITDPAGVVNEVITFNRFIQTETEYAEGEEYNTYSVKGVDHETMPTYA